MLNFTLACPAAKLTVNILDVNDNTPQFKPFGITYYTEQILEGATPGTTLIAVAAVDPDKGLNGLITYSLLDLVPPGYVQLEDPSAGSGEICQRRVGMYIHLLSLWAGPWLASCLWLAPRQAVLDARWSVCHSLPDTQSRGKGGAPCPVWDGNP